MADADGWGRAARASVLFAPLHATLPAALVWLWRACGTDAAQLAVAGIHAAFPFLYLLIADRMRFGFAQWAVFLLLNHGVILLCALPLLW